jgi:hypothetical protein
MGRIGMRRLLAVVLLVAGTYSVPAQNLSDRIAACRGEAQQGRDREVDRAVPHKPEDPPPPADRSTVHVIQITTQWVNGTLLVITTVRLFANSGVEHHGPPVYEVVLGAPLPGSSLA